LKHLDYKRWRKTDIRLKLRCKSLCFNTAAIKALQSYTLALYGARNNILHDGDEETAAIVNSRLNDEFINYIETKRHSVHVIAPTSAFLSSESSNAILVDGDDGSTLQDW
jgi:hypothetical protein